MLLLLRCGVDDDERVELLERVALLVLPERICLLVLTDVLLRCGVDDVDDERVALVVRPERMSLFGCALRWVACVPGAPRLAPAA